METDLHIDQHISHTYNEELEALRQKTLAMGRQASKHTSKALKALIKSDAKLAEKIANADYKINDMEIEIDASCTQILALRQPAASDLRLVMTIIRMSSDLEQIGDEAQKIASLALKLSGSHLREKFQSEPYHIGRQVVEMLDGALDAFERMDTEAAIRVASQDPGIDQEFESLTRLLISHVMEDPRDVKSALRVNWCARALERIGDHAVKICEYVVYLVKGEDVRHVGLDQLRREYLAET